MTIFCLHSPPVTIRPTPFWPAHNLKDPRRTGLARQARIAHQMFTADASQVQAVKQKSCPITQQGAGQKATEWLKSPRIAMNTIA